MNIYRRKYIKTLFGGSVAITLPSLVTVSHAQDNASRVLRDDHNFNIFNEWFREDVEDRVIKQVLPWFSEVLNLFSVYFLFHEHRVIQGQSAYIDYEWYQKLKRENVSILQRIVDTGKNPHPVPYGRIREIYKAYNANYADYRGLYKSLQDEDRLYDYSEITLLTYLAEHSALVYYVDPNRLKFLSNFTGFWPFCSG